MTVREKIMQKQPGIPWLTLGQFAFSGLALLAFLSLALLFAVSALFGIGQGSGVDALQLWMRASGVFLAAVLVIPSVGLALLRLLRQPISISLLPWGWMVGKGSLLLLAACVVIWALAWWAGTWVLRQAAVAWVLAPVLYLLVGALPILGVLLLGSRGLAGGSGQRRWGIFSTALAGSTLVILVLEILALLAIVVLVSIAIASRPDWAAAFSRLAQSLSNSQLTPEALTSILQPYLNSPWLIALVLAYTSLLVPLIEELLKPLPVWLLLGKRLSPAEGFVAGLVSGAGFAFFESMSMLTAVDASSWLGLTAGRAGTDLLHITTAGLMGWALATTWQDRRYARPVLVYAGVVVLHGLWNIFSLSMGLSPSSSEAQGLLPAWLHNVGIGGLIFLLVGLLGLLVFINQNLRRQQQVSLVESTQPEGVNSSETKG